MIRGKKIYAIIPARGGSKGIPRKNLYKINGVSILERTVNLAQKCHYIDKIYISTDDDEMFEIAKRLNVNTQNKRPKDLATDSALTIDVLLHTIDIENIENDAYILLLQTTSPLRSSKDLADLFQQFERGMDIFDSCVSITEHDDPHPNKIQKIENGFVLSYLGTESMVPRQSLPKVYRLNGAFYLTDVKTLKNKRSFFTEHTMPFHFPKERSVNLDTMMDLYLLETILEKKLIEVEE
ncbi:MAG: acylneuraminate cytidylyltransferase family protein [Sulfuricurvum sp.]|uniref:acylneuraminate cytidylyltransferase family protein n=1 Tax=Sulfuricurvum sp. TaxID=2025608 RepID=UPI0025ED52C7|nr:acylneuraminate cytidylyltransferase family protein [Sulfuricurvum sp.]MBV5320166.1 acylneuraminate cytidylyltransferase family protein [Sulfuricurvum sp.]